MAKQSVEKPQMKECFGISMGWFMEDLVGDLKDRQKCYDCADYERCYQMCMLKATTQLRFEVRRAARTLGNAFGGSHSQYPF